MHAVNAKPARLNRELLILASIGGCAGILPLFLKPIVALGAMGGIILLVLIIRNPVAGLYLVAATIPLEVAGRIGTLTANLPLTIPKILTVITLAAWLINLALKRYRFRQMSWMHLLTAMWLWTCVTLLGASEPKAGYEAAFRFGTTVIFFFLVVQLARDSRTIKRCLAVFLLVSTVAAGYSIVERYLPGERFEFRHGWEEQQARRFGVEKDIVEQHMVGIVERSSGLSVHSIILSLNVALLLPVLGLFFSLTPPKAVLRIVWLVALGIMIAAVILSFARTGFILVLFALLMIFLKRLLRLTPSVVVTLLLAVIIAGALAPKKYFDRVLSAESYTLKSKSLSTRLEAQKGALQQFLAHPIMGEGFGNRYGIFKYFTTYPDKKHAVTPHNAYIHVAALTGIPGIVFICLFFWKLHRHLIKAAKLLRKKEKFNDASMATALDISILVFLLSGLALDLFDKGMPQAWLLTGLSAALIYNSSSKYTEIEGKSHASTTGYHKHTPPLSTSTKPAAQHSGA